MIHPLGDRKMGRKTRNRDYSSETLRGRQDSPLTRLRRLRAFESSPVRSALPRHLPPRSPAALRRHFERRRLVQEVHRQFTRNVGPRPFLALRSVVSRPSRKLRQFFSWRPQGLLKSVICMRRAIKRQMVFASGNGGRNNRRKYKRDLTSTIGC